MAGKPKSLDELKTLRRPLRNVNLEYREKLSRLDKLALFVTKRVGTPGFFLIIFVWTALWISWNVFAPHSVRFDPYPAFVRLWLGNRRIIRRVNSSRLARNLRACGPFCNLSDCDAQVRLQNVRRLAVCHDVRVKPNY